MRSGVCGKDRIPTPGIAPFLFSQAEMLQKLKRELIVALIFAAAVAYFSLQIR